MIGSILSWINHVEIFSKCESISIQYLYFQIDVLNKVRNISGHAPIIRCFVQPGHHNSTVVEAKAIKHAYVNFELTSCRLDATRASIRHIWKECSVFVCSSWLVVEVIRVSLCSNVLSQIKLITNNILILKLDISFDVYVKNNNWHHNPFKLMFNQLFDYVYDHVVQIILFLKSVQVHRRIMRHVFPLDFI